MSYDVSFKAKLDGADQWVFVGPQWINHTCNTAAMIKEVCGSYPSEWNNAKCSVLLLPLTAGCKELRTHSERYRQFEAPNGLGTVETTLEFLETIRKACEEYPTAILSVNY